jgi:hypothetical protein
VPTFTLVPGVPLMVGGLLVVVPPPPVFAGRTSNVKPGRETVEVPSVTEMVMLSYARWFAAVGVPDSLPVLVLNEVKGGACATENLSLLPSASLAVGWKLHAVPTKVVVVGVPLIFGAAAKVVLAARSDPAASAIAQNNFARGG